MSARVTKSENRRLTECEDATAPLSMVLLLVVVVRGVEVMRYS